MSKQLIIAFIGGVLLQAVLPYLIISTATKAEKRARYEMGANSISCPPRPAAWYAERTG